MENNIVHIDQIVTYLSEAEELYSVHPWCGPFAGTSVGSIVHHSRLSSFKHYNISTFSFFIQLSRFMSTKSSKILFHLLLHNRVKYQYSVESILHTCWSDCYLLITSWRVILQCIFGVLRLLGHPAWWILGVPTGKPFLWKIFHIKTHIKHYVGKEATHQTLQFRLSLDPCCAPFAASSITVDNHLFNIIIYWYSLSGFRTGKFSWIYLFHLI